MEWMIGDKHPEYGVVSAMGIISGERYRWFVKGNVVSMIPLYSISDKSPDKGE